MASERSSRHRSASSSSRSISQPMMSQSGHEHEVAPSMGFVPCVSTASHFLYAQGKDVISLHHDTLALDRRFEKHKTPVKLLCVDNVSERGAGRLVVSYDSDKVAIIWDLFTGAELTRFTSFYRITVAAWMKNGNVSFGTDRGDIILFEPATSEHKSTRTIYDPVTAIAPAADCHTYAIGYDNGSVFIASVAPTFTILHTVSTDVTPSSIVGLAWHASSSKSKSDMLAVQSASGDLRVWNIAKPASADIPKPIRSLERGGNGDIGLNWISWSKNGRIIQYSKGEILAWDVRTKQVAYVPVPVVETVRGLANYGPSAVLFTLSPEFSVQQYDLTPPQQEDLPAMFTLTKSIRHDAQLINSTQSTPRMNSKAVLGAAPPVPVFRSIDSHRGPSTLSTIQRATDPAEHARMLRGNMASPLSSRGGDTIDTRSVDSRSSTGRSRGRRDRAPSMVSYAASGTTFSTMSPSYIGRETAASPFWPQTASVASSSRRSKTSRLRQEVPQSPDGNLIDLFPYTRARLSSMPYQPGNSTLDVKTAPAQDLRLQMLRIVFGWHSDIQEMIRDEMARHSPSSLNATLLSKWLGEVDINYMSMMGSDSVTSTDWMLLALSSMGNQGDAAKAMGRGFAQKLLQQDDIHTAATILLAIKDLDEAIDIYVSRNYFMEGILLTTLVFPDDWQRQSGLVRRWGDYVVENSQQHLAIRCFTVTGTDTSLPWATPTQSPFEGQTNVPLSQPDTLSPPNSPSPESKQQQRMTLKSSSLKLITSFATGNSNSFQFPGLKTDDRTPTNVIGITPIAESAMSPNGTPSTYLRPNGLYPRTPRSERRHRLSSIGETSIAKPNTAVLEQKECLSTSEMEGDSDDKEQLPNSSQNAPVKLSIDTTINQNQIIENAPLTLSSARYDPREEEVTPKITPQTAIPNSALRSKMFSNSEVNAMNNAREGSRARNGSKDRKPTGLHIQMPTLDQLNLNAIATGADGRTPVGRRPSASSSSLSGSNSGRPEFISPPTTGQSWASSAKSPSVSGRSTDQYISSLDSARAHKEKLRSQRSRERQPEHKSYGKSRGREPSEDRGRSGNRYIKPAKRSPSSPKPMSPEDFQRYRSLNSASVGSNTSRDSSPEDDFRTRSAKGKGRSTSKLSDTSHISRMTARKTSPEPPMPAYRSTSRQPSIPRLLSPTESRGRSRSKNGVVAPRSPSSPLPMSDQAQLYKTSVDDYVAHSPLKLVDANRERLRSRQRSTSRKPRERGVSTRREESRSRLQLPEDKQISHDESSISRHTSDSYRTSDQEKVSSDATSDSGLRRTKSHRTLKREIAARELEARRESFLARTAATIPVPVNRPSPPSRTASDSVALESAYVLSSEFYQEPPTYHDPIDRSASAGPYGTQTPRAMRHPRHTSRDDAIPSVPEVPIEWSVTGHPIQEMPRSMSVPAVSQQGPAVPADMPVHPAFLRQVRPSANKSSFAPLTEIGRHRRVPSITNGTSNAQLASIGETLQGTVDVPVIDVPESIHSTPGVIPELQHLACPPPPPPAPRGPPASEARLSFSTSSGLGIGSIAIVMDDNSPSGTPVIEVGQSLFPTRPGYADEARLKAGSPPLPPLPLSGNSLVSPNYGASSPPPSEASGKGHRRGRGSINESSNKFTRMTDRMRSTSRPRNQSKARTPQPVMPEKPISVPYETKVGGGSGSGGVSYF